MLNAKQPALQRALAIGLASATVALIAGAQRVPQSQSASVADPRPLSKAAEILVARYGVPISYEDVSSYTCDGDLADPIEFRISHPGAKVLPPRSSTLNVSFEDLQNDPRRPALSAGVSKLLAGILEQHERNGNPGHFKLIETAMGLVIVPTAVRNREGTFVADQSLLDLRISFPEAEYEATSGLIALCKALSAASGKEVNGDNPMSTYPFRLGANNEIARDVLARYVYLSGSHIIGIGSTNGIPSPRVKGTWTLTLEPGIDPHIGKYRLSFHGVFMGPTREPMFQCVPPALGCTLLAGGRELRDP